MIISFGYSYGVPASGKQCRSELLRNSEIQAFISKISFEISQLPPEIVIAIGCDLGRHRSVTIVETLKSTFKNHEIVHRDVLK